MSTSAASDTGRSPGTHSAHAALWMRVFAARSSGARSPAHANGSIVTSTPAAWRARSPRGHRVTVAAMERTLFEDEHELFRDSVRAFIAKELAPHHEAWERGRHRRPRPVHQGRRPGLPRHGGARGPRRRRGGRLPVQRRDRRGDPAGRRERRRAGLDPPQRHLPPLLPHPHHRRAEGAVAPGHLLGRADHRHRHDRAGHRLRPRVDDHHRDARRRPLRRERLEDLHHQRHQRRPRDHRGEDRPHAAPRGDEPARARARHAGLRARPQPREDRHARAGHRRAVLHRRRGPRRQPPRRGGQRVPLARRQAAAGAAVDRGHRRGRRRARRSTSRSST